MVFVKYNHHGKDVWVEWKLMGKHREHCLCFQCILLDIEDREKNCSIANQVFDLCVKENLVLPVWECPKFKSKE